MTDTEFPTARVIWKARAIGQDINDPGGIPEEIPLGGIKVDLIPSPKVIECTNGAGDPVTYRIKEWHLVTANNGELINYEDPTNGIEIVASDAFPGHVLSWKSIIEDPSGTLPPIIKKWLAPTGSTIDLTTVAHVPSDPNPIEEYLQAVADARAAAEAAAADAERAEIAAGQATAPTDEMVVGLLADSGSAVATALNSAFAPIGSARPGSRFVFLGDSITAASDSGVNVNRGDAWVVFAWLLSKLHIGYVRNAGVGGNTTAQMLARFDADVAAFAPSAVTIAGGMNDAPAVSLAAYASNIRQLVAAVRAIGAVPILVTITPCIVEGKGPQIAVYNTWLRRYATFESLPLLDFWNTLVDPLTGGLSAAYDSGDGKHPNPDAHYIMGQIAAAELASILPSTSAPLSMSNADPTNLLTNSLFLVDSNADGLADNWTKYSAPAGSTTSIVDNAGMRGKAQRITCTGTTATTWLRQIRTTGFAVGDRLQISGLVESSGVAPNIQFQFGGSVGNVNLWPVKVTRPVGLAAYLVEFTVPAETVNLQFFLQATAGTGWADFGQPAIRNLTALGIA